MLQLLEQQQRLTTNQWKIISAAILGDMLDFFDFFLIGYVLAFIVGEWKLTFLESGAILLAAGIGAIPGAFFWGWRLCENTRYGSLSGVILGIWYDWLYGGERPEGPTAASRLLG